MGEDNKIQLFENQPIRTAWNEELEEWYFSIRAIDKGMPIEQVQKILGHSQIDTTMQYAMVNQTNVKTSHQKYMS